MDIASVRLSLVALCIVALLPIIIYLQKEDWFLSKGQLQSYQPNTLEYKLLRMQELLEPFMCSLEEQRRRHLQRKKPFYVDVWELAKKRYAPVKPLDPDYSRKVEDQGISTVNITLDFDKLKPYVINKYYNMTIYRVGNTHAHQPQKSLGDWITGNKTQSLRQQIASLKFPTALNQDYLHHKMLAKLEGSPNVTVSYLHLIPDGLVLPEGEVICNSIVLHPGGCLNRSPAKLTERSAYNVRFYQEVFTISQYWGEGYFHFSIEDLPRLAPYLPFLLQHEQIQVHVLERTQFAVAMLEYLGIRRERVVQGFVKGRLVYMPSGTRCGSAETFSTQLLSVYLRCKTTREQLVSGHPTDRGWPRQEANQSLVLIKRSAKRYFLHHPEILRSLIALGKQYNTTIRVFSDIALPVLGNTAKLFAKTGHIVGPHGAGLSNMLFSCPGTKVVEVICTRDQKFANTCYSHLAFILGLVYFAIIPEKDCFEITSKDLIEPIRNYLLYS